MTNIDSETPQVERSYTAFLGSRRLAQGSLADVAQALSAPNAADAPILVFNDLTGELVDAPPGPEQLAKLDVNALPTAPSSAAAAPAVGRPRLGVVAREVTLLPRHWQWLSAQPGGASAALRRLVEEARRTHAERDAQRAATERAYRFMSAIAGHEAGFEEAARALFAHDELGFSARIDSWPPDVRAHLTSLAQDAFKSEARS
ncbi:DUF2239 family protein [Ottowia thiooxydans]|uniref:DUF2239 family protein n=1 Tax=Ottowia thiooxydans TaxID=219182 RepID=UPI0003F9AA79|nr:DUF2239 family protein [Ottowia thiooxydans]